MGMEIPWQRVGDIMKRKERKKMNNTGTTMVETLAAFTVLAIVLTMLFHIVSFCGKLRMMAVDSGKLQQLFLREAYRLDSVIRQEAEGEAEPFIILTTYTGTGDPDADKTVSFTMMLDTSRTEMMESYTNHGNRLEEGGFADGFRLNYMGAKSYECKDPIIDEEQLNRPVMMNFVYESPKEESAPAP